MADHHIITFALDSVDQIMSKPKQPKVLLFDIGGVCVVSPFQEILNYELNHNIPPGWVNYSISKTSPNGAWHKQERGETLMDAQFFANFNEDLRDPGRWKTFYKQAMQKEGLAVDDADIPPVPEVDGEWMFWEMMRASRAPDPWMWPALQVLKKSGHYILAALSNTMIYPEGHEFNAVWPNDVRGIFDVFISSAHVGLRKPDLKIYQLAVDMLDEFAKKNAKARGREDWAEGVKPNEIVFLDDIGENLKTAKKSGFGTIKVNLGEAYEAVDQLEELTGLKLAGDHPRVSSAPKRATKRIAKL